MVRTILQIPARVVRLSGWRRGISAFAAGAVSCLALPPFNAVVFLFVSYIVLVWLIDGVCLTVSDAGRGIGEDAKKRVAAAFRVGWLFGFGQFLVGLYWVSNALLVDAQSFGWAVPIAALLLPAGLSFFPALGIAAAAWFWSPGSGRIFLLAACWAGAEWLRGHAFTGFPWNLIGYAWVEGDAMRQGAALVGIYGLSLVTVLLAAAPAVLAGAASRTWSARAFVGATAVAACVLWAWGSARMGPFPNQNHPGIQLRVVQPNIDQHLKWRADKREHNLERHLLLSSGPGASAVSHLVWPEAATPYYLGRDRGARQRIGQILGADQILLAGSLRAETAPDGTVQYWNGFHGIDGAGTVVATYDKSHLVPFGEYLPFRSVLSRVGLGRIAFGLGDYSAGPGRKTLEVPRTPPFSPLICYEVIFPGDVARRSPRPSWLLNLTNDAWYGMSTGPYQHLAMARMRAVEEGLPLVRSANTGVSAIIDPYGRFVARLGLGEGGVIDGPLPLGLENEPIFARWGDAGFVGLLLMFLLAARVFHRKH